MRLSFAVPAGSVALAAAAVIGFRLHSSASAADVPVTARPSVERFMLQSSGDVPDCVVEKAEGQGLLAHILLATDCDAILPGLSKLHYWSEKPDGSVEFSADGKTPAVVFAQADGVAYESVEPRTPLMSLIEGE